LEERLEVHRGDVEDRGDDLVPQQVVRLGYEHLEQSQTQLSLVWDLLVELHLLVQLFEVVQNLLEQIDIRFLQMKRELDVR